MRPRSAVSAVHAETATAAACSNVTLAGLGTSVFALQTASSANVPSPAPNTSSPGRSVVTSAPTDSTTPATSIPITFARGLGSPKKRRPSKGRPVMTCHAPWSTPAARTRTSTSRARGTGVSTSRNSRPSGPQYSSRAIAFMVIPPF
jgi:hypothetical protein